MMGSMQKPCISHLNCSSESCRSSEFRYRVPLHKAPDFAAYGIPTEYVHDNESCSSKGVLRGLHFQKTHTQGKLVRVTSGRVYDVAVDVRPGSETFGKWVGIELDSEKKNMFYIPAGFAHGFLVLSDSATSNLHLQMHRRLRSER